MNHLAQREAARLIVRALNILLTAQGAGYRVKGMITMTRVNGHVVIAIPEVKPHEAGDCPPPTINF